MLLYWLLCVFVSFVLCVVLLFVFVGVVSLMMLLFDEVGMLIDVVFEVLIDIYVICWFVMIVSWLFF